MDDTWTPLPEPKAVRDVLLDLLDRSIDVGLGDAYAPGPEEPGSVAVYVDDLLRVRVVVAADLRLSAYAGAAIGLVPPPGATAAIADRELPTALEENFHEVLNIFASLLNGEGVPHVRLHAVHPPGSLPPSDVATYTKVLGRRLDLVVDVGGYGRGRLSVVGVG